MNRASLLCAALLITACGRSAEPGGASTINTAQPQGAGTTTTTTTTTTANAWRPDDGFVVHEWGTLTFVVGSDGSLVTGLHHEEEDLPPFVADRMAQGPLSRDIEAKMETPVTYFYAPAAMTASAKVTFPRGLLTQWFPYAQHMAPRLAMAGDGTTLIDPWLEVIASLSPTCEARMSQDVKNGLLDWGKFQVLAPGAAPALAGPLGDTTWHFARNVASNPIAVPMPDGSGLQHEKFLFYRGLGTVDLPLQSRFEGDRLTLRNAGGTGALGGLFLMKVTPEGAAFRALGDLTPGATVESEAPAPVQPLTEFVAALKAALKARLAADGLYADEAQAMVDTWERSYFLTPGVRLLYLLPQAQTDAIIPLTITPAPAAQRRTMVIRLELLTPEQEQAAAGWISQLGDSSTRAAAEQRFRALGRFAEPTLRRALALAAGGLGSKEGEALVLQLRGTRRWSRLSVE
jgi:hypothetical protein